MLVGCGSKEDATNDNEVDSNAKREETDATTIKIATINGEI
ncbi:hypothetical protein [Lysinibacillus fusiformis]